MMKNFAALAFAASLAWLPNETLAASKTPEVVGPEYAGTFDAVTGDRRVKLERQKLTSHLTSHAFGMAGATVYLQASGEQSTIRFRAGDALCFIVRVETQDRDPNETIAFYGLATKNGLRRLKVSQATFGGVSDKIGEQAVQFSATKYGKNFFKIVSLSSLSPGEYVLFMRAPPIAFGQTTDQVGFLFGVD